jgi:flagellar hook assembly protein FlgD
MPYSSSVKLDVYNVLGQKVDELYAGHLDAGSHQLTWDGRNSDGDDVTSGVYFYRLQAGGFDKTKKMLLVK